MTDRVESFRQAEEAEIVLLEDKRQRILSALEGPPERPSRRSVIERAIRESADIAFAGFEFDKYVSKTWVTELADSIEAGLDEESSVT